MKLRKSRVGELNKDRGEWYWTSLRKMVKVVDLELKSKISRMLTDQVGEGTDGNESTCAKDTHATNANWKEGAKKSLPGN